MKKWIVRDGVGREYEVTLDAVRRDYVSCVMQMDGLTKKQAEKHADENMGENGWDDYWFPEQMADSLRLVQSVGKLVKDISPEEKEKVINAYAIFSRTEIISEASE